MSGQITKKPEVWRDLIELSDYIAAHNSAAASRFLDAADSTFERLAENPDLGFHCDFPHPDAAGLRVWRITGFRKYLIFYRPTDYGIDVIRVLHGARELDRIFDPDSRDE